MNVEWNLQACMCFFSTTLLKEWIPNNIKASVCDIPPKAQL